MLMTVTLLSGLVTGPFIGRFGARKAMVAGNVMSASGLLLLAVHSQLWQFYLAYGLLIGLGAGTGGILAASTVASNWFLKKTPFAMGVVMAAGGLGAVVMVPLIMAMINAVGWRSTYLALFGVMLFIGAIVTGLLVRNRPEDFGQLPDGPVSKGSRKTTPRLSKTHYVTPVDFTAKEAFGTGTMWIILLLFNTVFFTMGIFAAHQIAFHRTWVSALLPRRLR